MARILIVGANSFDSGKTSLAANLATCFKDSGQLVEYFKPISGHNYWYNYEHTRHCLETGQLVSKDATIMKNRLELKTESTLANPIHSLFVPAKIEKPLQNIHGTLGLGGSSAVLIMQRFSRPVNGKIDTTILLAQSLVEEERVIIRSDEIDRLSHGSSIQTANTLETFQEYEELHFEEIVSDSFALIERASDSVIIESFNDSTWPWNDLEQVDHVLAVSPGHVFSYDPERFKKASYLSKRNALPIREVTFSRVSDLLKPTAKIQIRPMNGLDSSQLKNIGIY
ncbi:hypothetical protein EU527_10205 [Candidatus Thorarchaeota archaeon]|nr:MAG: hypothetical protein EU527_10205 [Candidatus Thorarchaeota archaeon]